MRLVAAVVISLFALGFETAFAAPEDEVHARFLEWIATFNSNDAGRLSQLYDQNARLFATGGSEKPVEGRDAVRAYFTPGFSRGRNSVTFDHDDAVKVFGDIGIETGYYHFNVIGADGKPATNIARYTFIFQKKDGTWMIVHHHSSRVPNLTPPGR